ncbi:hypothetical protein, partial [Nocardioides sp.]|uniref:hypothetical protein n=1 Tax=Nocardioides sp. TaxID=35761 RepID=UPI002C7E5AC3
AASERDRARAQARHARALTRYLEGKLPGTVLDAEDAALAEAVAAADRALARLPQAPDVAALRRSWDLLSAAAGVVHAYRDDELAAILSEAGTVVVSREGVRLAWGDRLVGLGDPPAVPLPRAWAVRPRAI